jgi:glucosyl-dolichyl phosphate glucuronosyltransferase
MITVALCTWNRSRVLQGTLEAISRLAVPGDIEWEVLVVNNNSTDDTADVVSAFGGILPLRCHVESRQGIAFARNAVLRHARGDFVVWLDDDCRPARNHILRYVECARRWPQAALFSGGIEPEFESAPPAWIADNLDVLSSVYGQLVRKGPSRQLSNVEGVLSGNMATRTAALSKYAFDTTLGRVGSSRCGGEETDMFMRLMDDGHKAIWVAGAEVRHFIPRSAMTLDYITRTFIGEGRVNVRLYDDAAQCRRLCGVPLWIVRQWCEGAAGRLLLWPTCGRRWVESVRRHATAHGMIQGSLQHVQGNGADVVRHATETP